MINLYEAYIVPFSIGLPLIIGVVSYTVLTTPYKIILYFLVLSAFCNGIAVMLAIQNIPNLLVIHIYTIFEFFLISLFYWSCLDSKLKSIIFWTACMFGLLCVLNVLFIQTRQFNTYSRSLEAIVMVSYSLKFLHQQSTRADALLWSSIGLNWINSGILVYFSPVFLLLFFQIIY